MAADKLMESRPGKNIQHPFVALIGRLPPVVHPA
jgi:hypothetical protein